MSGQAGDYCKPSTRKAEQKRRQHEKIRQIGEALVRSGFSGVDLQSKVLNVPRSTAWVILKASHKASGLSASVLKKMLASNDLPPAVRAKILEYINEKMDGLYGDDKKRLQQFKMRLAEFGILAAVDNDREQSRRPREALDARAREKTEAIRGGLRSRLRRRR
jgi:hypothetical protein